MPDDIKPDDIKPDELNQHHFRRSDSIAELSKALAVAQGQIKGAAKDSANPFFKSKYADIASIMDACREPLSKAGLAIIQFPRTTEKAVEVETLLCHASGEWVCETLCLPVGKYDAHGIGSAITYARRYALAAITGVCPEDDDGNAAAASSNAAVAKVREQTLASLNEAAYKGTAALEMAWKALPGEARTLLKNDLPALKKRAEEVAA